MAKWIEFDCRLMAGREIPARRRLLRHTPRRRRHQTWFGRLITNLIRPYAVSEAVPVPAVVGGKWRRMER